MSGQQQGDGSINIGQLTLEQLDGLMKQMQADVNSLSVAHDSLRDAQSRFMSNREVLDDYEKVCVAAREDKEKPQEALLCISSALYAIGRIVPSDRVLVDVGTDYFLEKSMGSAKTYFANRAETVRENMDTLEKKLRVKQTQLAQVADVMRTKQAAAQRAAAAEGN